MSVGVASLGHNARGARVAACLALALALGGCSMLPTFLGGTPPPAKPAELPPNPNLLGVRQAWTVRLGPVQMPLSVQVTGSEVAVASSDGQVALLDAASGAQRWRTSVEAPLSAGVGSDGRTAAVITRIVAPDMIAACTASEGFSIPGCRNLINITKEAIAPNDSATPLLVNHTGAANDP
jgi:hypothetical protein